MVYCKIVKNLCKKSTFVQIYLISRNFYKITNFAKIFFYNVITCVITYVKSGSGVAGRIDLEGGYKMVGVNILVVSDNFEKWIEKFKNEMKIRFCKINKNEVMLYSDNSFFKIEIRKSLNENCRGKVVDVLILDKFISGDILRKSAYSMMGHRNSIIRTENFYEGERET